MSLEKIRRGRKKTNKNKILLCGIQKVGTTWVRFVVFNYYNILNQKATKSLTWDELEAPHLLRVAKGINYLYNDGYPLVFHTHRNYQGYGIFDSDLDSNMPAYFDSFDKLVYAYRNPFDTIISYKSFMLERTTAEPFGDGVKGIELEKLKSLEGFTDFYLPRWIRHVKTTMHKADLIMDYNKTWYNPFEEFLKIFRLIDDDVKEDILKKSIEMSSFTSIRKMSEDINQKSGLGYPYYTGYFCRVGTPFQYQSVMNAELIHKIRSKCRDEGLTV